MVIGISFAQAEKKREAEELIRSESLNEDAAKRYITASLKREYASENGTDLNSTLPKMSPLNPRGQQVPNVRKINDIL
jgi:type I restriction enzyme R subunit